jgi:hypothetical protein
VNGKLLYVHPPPGNVNPSFHLEVYDDEDWIARQVKKLTFHDQETTTTENEVHSPGVSIINKMDLTQFDKDFFGNQSIGARTRGGTGEFTRVKSFPYQEGYNQEKSLPSKKSHKKEKRKKVHVHWTAMD